MLAAEEEPEKERFRVSAQRAAAPVGEEAAARRALEEERALDKGVLMVDDHFLLRDDDFFVRVDDF